MPYNNLKSEDIFKCQKCGDCCKGYGGTFITEKEIETIAAHIHTDPDTVLCEKASAVNNITTTVNK